MALEASDLNHGDILKQSTQENDGKGNIRFKIQIDGETITSEWIGPDNRKEALHKWPDAVIQNVTARADLKRQEERAKARRRAQEQDKSLIELPPGVLREEVVETEERMEETVTAAPSSSPSGQIARASASTSHSATSELTPLQYALVQADKYRTLMLKWERMAHMINDEALD